jgi:hypothetical protein
MDDRSAQSLAYESIIFRVSEVTLLLPLLRGVRVSGDDDDDDDDDVEGNTRLGPGELLGREVRLSNSPEVCFGSPIIVTKPLELGIADLGLVFATRVRVYTVFDKG